MTAHGRYLGLGNCAREQVSVLLKASAPLYFDSSNVPEVNVYETAVVALSLWRESDMLVGECSNTPAWRPYRDRPVEASSGTFPACGCGDGKLPSSGDATVSLLGLGGSDCER